MTDQIEATLTKAQEEDLDAVMVVGVKKDGTMFLQSSVNNIAVMHWMLNKSVFEVNLYERNRPEEATEAAE